MSKRSNRDDINEFFGHGLYLPTRTLYLGSVFINENDESGVDALMAERAVKGLHILDTMASAGDKPINIILNTPGGDVDCGMAIYDAISQCNNMVYVKVSGRAYSMGAVILQAADKRIMSPNASIMLHYGQTTVYGEVPTVLKNIDAMKKTDKMLEDLFLKRIREKRPKYTLKQVKALLDRDTYLTASEAIELGLADEID